MPAGPLKPASLTLPLLDQSEDSQTSPVVQIHVGAGSPEPGARLPSPEQQRSPTVSQAFTADPRSATSRAKMMMHCPTAATPPPAWSYSPSILAVRVGEMSDEDTRDIGSPALDHPQTPSDGMPGPLLSQQHDTGAGDDGDVSHATTASEETVPADVPVTAFTAPTPAPAAVPASAGSRRAPGLTGLQAAVVVGLLASCCLGLCMLVSPCLPPASQHACQSICACSSSHTSACTCLPCKSCYTCPNLPWILACWHCIPGHKPASSRSMSSHCSHLPCTSNCTGLIICFHLQCSAQAHATQPHLCCCMHLRAWPYTLLCSLRHLEVLLTAGSSGPSFTSQTEMLRIPKSAWDFHTSAHAATES